VVLDLGWHVRVDGVQQPVLLAEFGFRPVLVFCCIAQRLIQRNGRPPIVGELERRRAVEFRLVCVKRVGGRDRELVVRLRLVGIGRHGGPVGVVVLARLVVQECHAVVRPEHSGIAENADEPHHAEFLCS